jgi:hypothetical protein
MIHQQEKTNFGLSPWTCTLATAHQRDEIQAMREEQKSGYLK